jgi:nucleotide-binding universal stress UspA family protein
MAFPSVLLHLDERDDVSRIGPLLDFARDFGGEGLTVVAAGGVVPPGYGVPVGPGLMLTREREIREAFADMKAEMTTRVHGVTLEWRSDVTTDPTGFVLDQLSRADLMIVSRPERKTGRLGDLDLGRLLVEAGRPVLIPADPNHPIARSRIAIAFKPTREGRLAVTASLPLLKAADRVVVIALGHESRREDLFDVKIHLSGHGVQAETLVFPDQPATGEALANAASSCGADLLVCGAYGSGRAREYLFGGVTRDLIASCRLPCLMIH